MAVQQHRRRRLSGSETHCQVLRQALLILLLLLLAQPLHAQFVKARPANDACSNATIIDTLPYSTKGQAFGATTISGQDLALVCNGVFPYFYSGLWFKLTASDENLCLSATTAGSSFDTYLAVYKGDCETKLECVMENDDVRDDKTSRLQFNTEKGVDYYILLAGDWWIAEAYELNVEVVDCLGQTSVGCENAMVIDEFPFTSQDTTELVPVATVPICNYITQWNRKGNWYKLAGSDGCYKITIDQHEFPEVIAIYEGTCGSLNCVDAFGLRNVMPEAVELQTEIGIEYYIFVAGYYPESFGTYTIDIIESDGCIAEALHDTCQGAMAIEDTSTFPITLLGNTQRSKAQSVTPQCGNIDSWNRRGAFYTFVSDIDAEYTASVGPTTAFEAAIAVYTSCDVCVPDAQGTPDKVTFKAAAGETVYIYIAGQYNWPTEIGEYTLIISRN